MKKMARREQRPVRFVAVPFRLRAITLALLAAAAGVLALVIALTPPKEPNFLIPRSARPDPPWPEGFVEFDASEFATARRLGSQSAPSVPPSASSARSPQAERSGRVMAPK